MPLIEVKTEIDAEIETCFDLARDVTFYQNTLQKPTEIAISGKVAGLVEKGDATIWETRHLNLHQHLTLKVTEFSQPFLFVDEMVKGHFKTYKHEHIFKKIKNKTLMIDKFYFESPYGVFGKLFDYLFLKKHIKKLIVFRNEALKDKAESL
ncbi:hypothetical protein PK35_14730 [Tamlana nanhaiensis]|uniref:Cell division protein n=1 Tax=Neotamlana nanhaiensis TaxID=1382798 RepID=A0A0D7VX60_9FLAO|nr:SRPBCC family protein [Tamlana nanhaiensis]KJD31364.1 hypothetical protein PK35_14730 [Tamlana nanhaiensis]